MEKPNLIYPTKDSTPRTFTAEELAGTFRYEYQGYGGPVSRWERLEINRVLEDGWVELKSESIFGKHQIAWSGCLVPEPNLKLKPKAA